MNYELAKEFRSIEQWKIYYSLLENQVFSSMLTAEIIKIIKDNGITDPLTGRHFDPHQVVINSTNYRETIRAGNIISRQRGILLLLRYVEKKLSISLSSRSTIIYAPEALTEFALYLRSIYPRFIGSEYATTESEMSDLWPIQAQDLTCLTYPDSVFDCVLTSDVMEHVSDINLSLSEIYRVLKPGCAMLSTFPFAFNKLSGILKSKIEDGRITHLMEPEFHGNPMRPSEGSLVFEIPGWDMLQRAKKVGFSDAFYCYVRSAIHGVLTGDINGVFVFVGIK